MSPRRRQEYESHNYSVWVDSRDDSGDVTSKLLYHGGSEYSARQAIAKAILDYPGAWRVDLRRDHKLLVRVMIERP
jgi:hypothetical protein